MKLKRLVIQGFKSFKDRTVVNFDQGITGIVGPNGCGKSNIVDALFWVMGEQSAKHLRGKSMKDLIFAGSSKYNPGGFAEATLVLENDDGKHIHIGNKVASPSEISLTRKLYRNGETEYRINGEPARLRDIQEVFMDTGAGAKSYSIIAQGEINRLVQAKPTERRVMIEEVAGITKFKMRKRESLRKIDATEQNLSRLNDLQIEIEKNLRALQKQAEKAERARNLKEKVRRNELVTNAHKVFDYLKNFRDNQTTINEQTLEVENWKTRKNQLEVSLEDERLSKDEQTAKIEDLQKEYNEVSKQLAAAEEKLNYLCKTQSEKEALIETREKEISEIEAEIENRKTRLEELKEEREKLEEQKSEGFDFSELEEEVENLKEGLDLKKDEAEQLREEMEASKEELQGVSQTVFRNNNRMEELSSSLQDITQEIEALENQYSGFSKNIADEREAVTVANNKAEELMEEEQSLKEQIETLKVEFKENNNSLQAKTKELIQTESKLNSLKEIRESLEGAKEGASAFLNEVEDEAYELLGNLVKCDDEMSKGVQALLGEFMNMVVTSTEDLEKFNSWLAGNSDKGLDLLVPANETPYSSETIERLKVKGLDGIQCLSDVVTLEGEFGTKMKPFFEGFYIVPSLEQEKLNAVGADVQFKAIASFCGKSMIRNVGGAKVMALSGDTDRAQGIVERNNKIEELDASLIQLTEEVKGLEEKVEFQKEDLENIQGRYDNLRSELTDIKSEAAAKSSALESKLANMETGHARLDILKNRKSEVSKQRLELIESEEDLGNKEEALKEQVSELTERFDELQDTLEMQQATYSEKREELLEKQVESKSFDERFNNLERQVSDVEEQVGRQNDRLTSNQELIEKYNQEIEDINNELKELEENNHQVADQLQEKEDVLNILKDNLAQLLQAMMEREEEVKKLNQDINKSEKLVVELEAKIGTYITDEEQVTRNIFEKYRVDLRTSVGRFLEYEEENFQELNDISNMYFMETEEGTKEIEIEPYEFHRRYGQDLKDCEQKFKNYRTDLNRLGEINWQAIEDYERQKLRFDFLKVQEQELKKSLEDLERAISHIDEKSRARFKVAYEEVNQRFQKVFPIIFGGGNATLKITGDINDPECGIEIIAQPPGKKMQNINLMSGGEKAMTAVSLIFSIFLVKPSPFCLLDEVDAPLDDANVGRFNELLREMSTESQFILITHNKKTMELNDTLYGVTMQEPGVSKAVCVQLH